MSRDKDAFDLFAGLESLTAGNFEWYAKLSDEGKKAAAPFVIMRWLSGTSDAAQIVRLNTYANQYMFSLGAEKELLFKLLAATTTRRPKRYYWQKPPGSKVKKLSLEVAKEYYGWSAREASMQEIDKNDLLEMAAEIGWDNDQISKLKKELA